MPITTLDYHKISIQDIINKFSDQRIVILNCANDIYIGGPSRGCCNTQEDYLVNLFPELLSDLDQYDSAIPNNSSKITLDEKKETKQDILNTEKSQAIPRNYYKSHHIYKDVGWGDKYMILSHVKPNIDVISACAINLNYQNPTLEKKLSACNRVQQIMTAFFKCTENKYDLILVSKIGGGVFKGDNEFYDPCFDKVLNNYQNSSAQIILFVDRK